MATLTVSYGDLSYTVNQSQALARRAREYSDALSRNVINRIGSLNGGSSSNTNQSADYLRRKMRELNSKAERHDAFAKKVSGFVQTVQNTDRAVKNSFEVITSNFKKTNNINISAQQEVLTNISIFFEKNPLFKWAGDRINDVGNWANDCCSNIKHWYKCEGGKYTVDAIIAGMATVAAVTGVVLACMTGIGGIVALAAVVGDVIWTLNSANDIYQSGKAALNANSNPLMAARYGEMDNLSDTLREEVHGPCAKLAYGAAGALDTTEAVCNIIGIAGVAKNVVKHGPAALKNLFGNKEMGLGKAFLTSTKYGSEKVVTLKSFYNGAKTLITDSAFRKELSEGWKTDRKIVRKTLTKDGFKDTARYAYRNFKGAGGVKGAIMSTFNKFNSFSSESKISKSFKTIEEAGKYHPGKLFKAITYGSDQLKTIGKKYQRGFMSEDLSKINDVFGITKEGDFSKLGKGLSEMNSAFKFGKFISPISPIHHIPIGIN